MSGGPLAVSFGALHDIAEQLRTGAARVAALGPGLLLDLASPGLGTLPLTGMPGGPGLLAEIGRCCGPAGLPAAAADLAALALRVRAAGIAYAAVEEGLLGAAAAALGPVPGAMAGPVATAEDGLAPSLGALALLVAWDVEHRLVPPGGRWLTDPVLDLLDLSVEGPASVRPLDSAALRAGGLDPRDLLSAGESITGALRAVAALSDPALPSTFVVARTGAGPPPRYVVCLPGLQRWWGADAGAADLPGAMATLTGHSSYVAGVRRQLATLPAGSEVLVVGHSQGGMVAQALAADRSLRAAGVMVAGAFTAGAPRLADVPPPDVPYLALESDGDPIPALRRVVAGGLLPTIPQPAHPGTVVVRFPATRPGHALANHGLVSGGYLDEAASADPRVSAFRRLMARFFTGSAAEVRAYQVTDGGLPIGAGP